MIFSKAVKDWAEKVKRRADYVYSQTAQDVAESVIDKTPVSTGRLAGSWSTDGSQYIGGESAWKGGVKNDAIAARNKAAATDYATSRVKLITSFLKYADEFSLINTVPYAPQAEYIGWDKTDAALMMDRTVQEFPQIVSINTKKSKNIK